MSNNKEYQKEFGYDYKEKPGLHKTLKKLGHKKIRNKNKKECKEEI